VWVFGFLTRAETLSPVSFSVLSCAAAALNLLALALADWGVEVSKARALQVRREPDSESHATCFKDSCCMERLQNLC
jgi:hypothetical protein